MDKGFIVSEITAAMRAQDKRRLSILRQVKNEIDVREKESKRALSDDEVVASLKKVLKQTGETLEASARAGTNAERTELLQEQVDILSAYLPQQMTGAPLVEEIARVIAEGGFTQKRDMGRVIALVVERTGGNCDKAEVAREVGTRLS